MQTIIPPGHQMWTLCHVQSQDWQVPPGTGRYRQSLHMYFRQMPVQRTNLGITHRKVNVFSVEPTMENTVLLLKKDGFCNLSPLVEDKHRFPVTLNSATINHTQCAYRK